MELQNARSFTITVPPMIKHEKIRRVDLTDYVMKYGRYVGEDNKEYFYFNGKKYSNYEDCISGIIKWIQH